MLFTYCLVFLKFTQFTIPEAFGKAQAKISQNMHLCPNLAKTKIILKKNYNTGKWKNVVEIIS